MTITEVICDNCGARKQQSNGWYSTVTFVDDPNVISLRYYDFDYNHVTKKDYCSQSCVATAIQDFMNEEPKQKAIENGTV